MLRNGIICPITKGRIDDPVVLAVSEIHEILLEKSCLAFFENVFLGRLIVLSCLQAPSNFRGKAEKITMPVVWAIFATQSR